MANLGDIIKKGNGAPAANQIATGSIAIDTVSGKAYSKKNDNTIFEIGHLKQDITPLLTNFVQLLTDGYVYKTGNGITASTSIPAADITSTASLRFVSDTDMSYWNAKQAALGYTPEDVAKKGVANGYAELDATGKVPSSQLPAYVDDVLEVSTFTELPTTGSESIIYVALDTNIPYRWSGSVYIALSSGGVADKAIKLQTARSIGMTGDVTWDISEFDGTANVTAGATLANSGVVVGTYGSATQIVPLTIDAKGRVTSAGTAITITPSWDSVTSKPTTIDGYGLTTETNALFAIGTY